MVQERHLAEINGLIALRQHILTFHDGEHPCPYCKEEIEWRTNDNDRGALVSIANRLLELGVEA